MPSKSIVKLGNKQLATLSLPVENPSIPSKDIAKLVIDMIETMRDKKGVGIAAPQICCNKRVIVFGFDKNERYPHEQPVPITILINPIIKILSDELVDGWEGCLSVPGLRGLVPRYNKIEYGGYEQDGSFITRVAEGFHARIVQHECDHLDGILFPQRIKDLRFFGFEDELSIN